MVSIYRNYIVIYTLIYFTAVATPHSYVLYVGTSLFLPIILAAVLKKFTYQYAQNYGQE